MSNSLAVATVTAAFQMVVKGAIDRATDKLTGADLKVTTERPTAAGTGLPKRGVNIYLFQVTQNPALANADVPTRRAGGQPIVRPQVALELHYLLSFFGVDSKWERERLFGIVTSALHAEPGLSREIVDKVVTSLASNASFAFMAGSDLGAALERVRFSLQTPSLEEFSKIWSVLLQMSHVLSVVYRASPVLIEAELVPQPALPVRTRQLLVTPLTAPVIERVTAFSGAGPITDGVGLRIEGQGLLGADTRVLVDGQEISPPPLPADVTEDVVRTAIAAGALRAGVHGAQIAHRFPLGDPPVPHRGVESMTAPFVLSPRVTSISVSSVTSRVVGADTLYSAVLALGLTPAVGRDQRVVLSLHEAVTQNAHAYSFVAKRDPAGPATSATVSIRIVDVIQGKHRLRVQIDGIDHVTIGADPIPEVTFP